MQQYKVVGVMSGTSLDGVDLAHCILTLENKTWHYDITHAETIPYDKKWLTRLTHLHTQPAFVYPKTDAFYGKYLGQLVREFMNRHNLQPDLISSHGHTIFHQPQNGFTAQIGNGANIYAETGIKTVCDFRTVDVALGGQGAPLVPVGDALLFADYDACLNLGGFCNISYNDAQKRVAFDIGPCNIVMNPLAESLNLPYDDRGMIARSGTVDASLLEELDSLEYYKITHAKSLGIEWVQQVFWPVVKKYEIGIEDLMATINRHIAGQVAAVITRQRFKTVLVTGGGAYNNMLTDNIGHTSGITITKPSELIIEYKEALIFAFLGALRLRNETNALGSVTGARTDSTGGCIYG
jgi:anhydro-N-acetylmuramic acid kinase